MISRCVSSPVCVDLIVCVALQSVVVVVAHLLDNAIQLGEKAPTPSSEKRNIPRRELYVGNG